MKKMTLALCVTLIVALVAGLAIPAADAASPMSTATMPPVSGGATQLWGTSIAVDAGNNVYVADDFNGKLRKFNKDGGETCSVSVAHPTAAAVDTAGRVLVATDYGKTIRILNADCTDSGLSVTGGPTKYAIQAIAVDDLTGNIYMADYSSNVISGYSASYAWTANVPVTVRKTTALAMRNTDLCIGDRPYANIISSYGNGYGDKSRIQCVNPSTGVASFTLGDSNFGYNEGNISMVAGMAVDSNGLIYVADPAQFALLVFDPSIASPYYAAYVRDVNQQMRTVNDLAISGSGIVYVNSLNTHDVKRFALDGGFIASPASLHFADVIPNGPAPGAQTLRIDNPTVAGETITCTASDTWITGCSGSVVVPATNFVDLSIDIITAGLNNNQIYAGTITLTNSFGDSQVVPVSMNTTSCSDTVGLSLVAVPGSWTVDVEQGRPAITRNFVVGNSSCTLSNPATITAVSTDTNLCTVASVVGDTVTVSCGPDSLAAGSYPNAVTVTVSDGDASPVFASDDINVNLNVSIKFDRYLAVTMGPGATNNSQVKVLIEETFTEAYPPFTAFDGAGVMFGGRPAMGDLDADGIPEIIVAKGENDSNNTEVKVFRVDGTPVSGANLVAFSSAFANGARVASGDLNGDGSDEVIVGTSSGHALVRAFSYDAPQNSLDDSGIMLDPGFAATTGGVNLAVADLDGNGRFELITSSDDKSANAEVKAWQIDTTGGAGAWVATAYDFGGGAAINSALAGIKGGASVAANMGVIAVASGNNGGVVEVYNLDGSLCRSFNVSSASTRQLSGIELSVGDVDNDSLVEVLVSGGAGQGSNSQVSIFNVDNCSTAVTASSPIAPVFGTAMYGARTALGQLQ